MNSSLLLGRESRVSHLERLFSVFGVRKYFTVRTREQVYWTTLAKYLHSARSLILIIAFS